MLGGQRFFDSKWLATIEDVDVESLDLDTMEEFLNSMPEDQLLVHALEFANGVQHGGISLQLSSLFEGTLRDQPETRKSMVDLVGVLEPGLPKDLDWQVVSPCFLISTLAYGLTGWLHPFTSKMETVVRVL
jgi:hypothetical protein